MSRYKEITTTAKVLTGSKQQIADDVASIAGEVSEAILFVGDQANATAASGSNDDRFTEMAPYTVTAGGVEYDRQAIYSRASV